MKVNASSIQPPGWQNPNHNPTAAAETGQLKGQASSEPAPSESAAPEGKKPASTQAQAKGVMRLLQEGHFDGVAGLRLRINFFDQLSALEQGQQQEAAREGVAELSQAMNSEMAALAESGAIGEESLPALQELTTGFLAQLEQSVKDAPFDKQATLDGLQQSFDAFDSTLRQLLLGGQDTPQQLEESVAEAAGEQVANAETGLEEAPPVPSETEEASGSDLIDPALAAEGSGRREELLRQLDDLSATFGNQLSIMEERLAAASLPPVPEAPDNQGGAYGKFLAIYHEMQGLASTPENAEPGT
jgi:hypothetical protein